MTARVKCAGQEGCNYTREAATESYLAARRTWLANAVHIDIDQYGRSAFPTANHVEMQSEESLSEWSGEGEYFSTRRRWLDNEEYVDIDLFGRASWATLGIQDASSYACRYLSARCQWTMHDGNAAQGLVGMLGKWIGWRRDRTSSGHSCAVP